MHESVVKVLKENLWYVATCDQEPNAVPVAFKGVSEDGKLTVGDVFMETTVNNVKANGRAAVSVCDMNTKEGYQIKGSAVYVTEGPVVEAYKAAVEAKFGGKMTAKGALTITPEKVIVTTPGPDNKKEV